MLRKKVLLILAIFVLSGCGAPAMPSTVIDINSQSGMSPNWEIVAFDNVSGSPTNPINAQLIGNAVLHWEETHPGRKIVSIQILYEPQTSNGYGDVINGLSIYSLPMGYQ